MTNTDANGNAPDKQSAPAQPDRFDPRYYTFPGRDELGNLLRNSLLDDMPDDYPVVNGYPTQHFDWSLPLVYERLDLAPDHGAFQRLIDRLGPDGSTPQVDPELFREALINADPLTVFRHKAAALNTIGRVLNTDSAVNPLGPLSQIRPDHSPLGEHLNLEPAPETEERP